MTQPPPDLPPVKADKDVTSRDDRFHCRALKVDFRVLGCVQRQATVRTGRHELEWSMCVGCEQGERMERQTGGPIRIETGVDEDGQAKSGRHRLKMEGSRPLVVKFYKIPLPPAPCAEPGCPNERGKYTSEIAGADDLCVSHRRRLKGERDRANPPPPKPEPPPKPKANAKEEPKFSLDTMERPLKPPPFLRVIKGEFVDLDPTIPALGDSMPLAIENVQQAEEAFGKGSMLVEGIGDQPGIRQVLEHQSKPLLLDMRNGIDPPAIGRPVQVPYFAVVGERKDAAESEMPSTAVHYAVDDAELIESKTLSATVDVVPLAPSEDEHDTEPPPPAAKTDPCPPPAHVPARRAGRKKQRQKPKTFAQKLRDSERRLKVALLDVTGTRRK